MAWQINGTPDTVSGGASAMAISDLTPLIFNQFLTHQLQNGQVLVHRIDSISTTTYAERFSFDGGADGTGINQTEIETANSGSFDEFCVMYGINISAEEKLFIANVIGAAPGSGASTAPSRREIVAKQTGTSSQYTSIETVNAAANDSNLSALGTD